MTDWSNTMSSASSRRDFLRNSGMVVMAGAAGYFGFDQLVRAAEVAQKNGASSADADYDRQKPTLVTIFLRGGADTFNAFVPYADPKYYEYRPTIAIPFKGEKKSIPILKSNYWAINPALSQLKPLMDEGKCVPMINVGSPDGTRSHFSAQDNMERGCTGENKLLNGWLNRYLEYTRRPYDAPLRGLSAMSLLPRALRGHYPVLAGFNSTEQMAMFEDLYSPKNMVNMTARDEAVGEAGSLLSDRPGQKRQAAVKRGLTEDLTRDIITESGANAIERIKALDKAAATPSAASYPGGALGSQLSTIARVIKANVGLEVAQADYDGWDHHRGQGGSQGQMTNMLAHLANCVAAFTQDLGPRMDKVMLLVMSEFGRTVHENGTIGTDHGHGGFMLAVGNMLSGGKVYGTHKGLDASYLSYERFQPVNTDFRAVFSESLSKLFHFDPFKANLFPGYKGTGKDYLNFAKQLKEV
jgi:uncharacterized protein (DUF1501 family)